MESKNAESIKNLLLKIVFPLAFPLAGAFICDLITNRANRNSSSSDSSGSSFQLEQSSSSICEEEEEEEEMASTRRAQQKLARTESACSTAGRLLISELARQASTAEEIMVAEATTEDPSEAASKQQTQDDHRTEKDEMTNLKLMVSALEDRACAIEAQFHEYCDMKEQESAYQKMQIMCLGMKLELLESQNQRLEAAAAEIRAAAEEFAAMRGKLDRLQGRFKKMSKRSKQDSDAVGERIVALDARQAHMARRCDEFEQAMEEMKQLTLQLLEQKGANDENVEVAVERSLRNLSSGRDLVDGLEALRDRWAAGMEEMIYLGWITAWLQHDLMLMDDDEDYGGTVLGGSSTYGNDDEYDDVQDDGVAAPRHPPEGEEEKKKGETMVASVPPSNQVELCKAGSVSSSGSGCRSVEIEPPSASCMGFAAASGGRARDGSGGWSIGRPRLIRKLRGWAAGGKAGGGGKATRCRIVGPCCQK